eukprot:TRINITY_DN555_c0_g2_i3.p1 TRINITY_DN555_c0_g2~~TRINITY_DN555_c0_g2_i3.p1  ORF type:complete len:343 (+),score=72.82 TRINITY_DN555_c0_g2_i3:440-1468(+)
MTQNPKLKENLTNVFHLNNLRAPAERKEDQLVADKLHLTLPDSHKGLLSKEELANLIGIFKTNTHNVPHMQGLGLYPVATMINHSCSPNSVYETIGTKMYLVAISPIAASTPVTLCYINPQQPRATRLEQLQSLYHFECKCCRCAPDARDHTRAFLCQICLNKGLLPEEAGVVCPRGDGKLPTEWNCSKCSETISDATLKEIITLEKDLKDTEPGLIKVNDLLRARRIHQTHHLLCNALSVRIELLAKIRPASIEKFITYMLSSMEPILPSYHPLKAHYYDLLAQVRKMTGDLKGCKDALGEALFYREKTCPKNSPSLLLARQKSLNPEKVEITLWYPTAST